MKEAFTEFAGLAQEHETKLWKGATIILDSSALLDLYALSRESKAQYLATLERLKKRLWMPHQVGLEFHRNRGKVLAKFGARYREAVAGVVGALKALKGPARAWVREHAPERLTEAEKLFDAALVGLKDCCDLVANLEPPNPEDEDGLLLAVEELFHKRVGKPFQRGELHALYEEGFKRFENQIPPGFRDANKGDVRQYGDFIVWVQMLARAQETQKPIVFVLNDMKGDWWLKQNGGRPTIPRPELRREMRVETGQEIQFYPMAQFFSEAQTRLKLTKDERAAQELADLEKRDGLPSNWVDQLEGTPSIAFRALTEHLSSAQVRDALADYRQTEQQLREAINSPGLREALADYQTLEKRLRESFPASDVARAVASYRDFQKELAETLSDRQVRDFLESYRKLSGKRGDKKDT